MSEKHYELTDETIEYYGHILHRIRAISDLPQNSVEAGELGGFIESYDNLSDSAWVANDAKVLENAKVCGSACVHGYASVHGEARVHGDAIVYGNAKVYGRARVFGNARVYDNACVLDNAEVCGAAEIYGNAEVHGDAVVKSNEDYIVFKNFWSSGRYFTWTRSNNMWRVGCFYGTGDELIKKAYSDSVKSGKQYKRIVDYVNEILEDEEWSTEKRRLSSMLCS